MIGRSLRIILYIPLLLLIFCIKLPVGASPSAHIKKDTIIIKPGVRGEMITADWKSALGSRISKAYIDSISLLKRALTTEEKAWEKLIVSKIQTWNAFKDSLAVPFTDTEISDTIYVLLGYRGNDDGFTFGYQTVCLDLTALSNAYGDADQPENNNRIDRIFAHEYTHLLHKSWAKKQALILQTFKDSILWECLYEGIGMYRSLNPKWIPVNGELPEVSTATLEKLCPVFIDRLITVETKNTLTAEEKEQLHKNLSRGSVDQKWGAFPVAIWLALEANGDDRKLRYLVSNGPLSVIQLAKKYLTPEHRQIFVATFK